MRLHQSLTVVFVCLLLAGAVSAQTENVPATLVYGDFKLPANFTSLSLPGTWNLNAGPVTIRYTTDLQKAPNIAATDPENWDLMGIVGLFSEDSGARMVGFNYDWGKVLYPSYPDDDASSDLDDKFNLQRFPDPGSSDEKEYDLNCASNTVGITPFNAWANYGIWFDRDGVDQYQATYWGGGQWRHVQYPRSLSSPVALPQGGRIQRLGLRYIFPATSEFLFSHGVRYPNWFL